MTQPAKAKRGLVKRPEGSHPQQDAQAREKFFASARAGELTVGQAVAGMRRLSKLTQPEFAARQGISVESLRAIEWGKANPTMATLNKLAGIIGLQVGFVKGADVIASQTATA
jgi:DNA-binding transcriptional regulator YiaG